MEKLTLSTIQTNFNNSQLYFEKGNAKKTYVWFDELKVAI